MAFDDPIVWILIIAVVVFLFGANKIPQFAKAIGQARREFDSASKELKNPSPEPVVQQPVQTSAPVPQPSNSAVVQTGVPPLAAQATDPLIAAAQKEGIDTQGKTRDQIATELAWKLKSK
jgi:sec-independent protein translocase protein TatA